MAKHLWETPHSYYCETGNFFKNGCNSVYESWEEFAQPVKTMFEGNPLYEFDDDLNLLYRWDWRKADPNDYLHTYSEETLSNIGATEEEIEQSRLDFEKASKTDTLYLFYMLQRKSYNISAEVKVVESDEPLIREWLNKKWQYMKGLWEPVSD